MLERVDEVHDNLVAALDWSVRDPELGLFLLARLARAWWVGGRAGDGIGAIDRLLDPEATQHAHPRAWVDAANSRSQLHVHVPEPMTRATRSADLMEQTAATIDDEYRLTFGTCLNTARNQSDGVEGARA